MRCLLTVAVAAGLSGHAAHSQIVRTSPAVEGAYTAPVPLARDQWYRSGTTPLEAYTYGQLTVSSALTVRPDGSVRDCRTSVSSKYPYIDDYTCDVLIRGARFAPARAPDGTPMYGVFRTWTQWGRLGGQDYHFSLLIGSAPTTVQLPARVDIMFLVDVEGRPSHCTDQDTEDDAALVELACQHLGRLMETPAVRTEEGLLVPSIQDATAAFVRDTRP